MAYDIIGGATPVWLKAVMVREGDDVVTRCCVVADGQFFPIEVRVNVPALIRQARALGIEESTSAHVGGFGSWLKKAVKKVTKSKIVRAVGKAVKKVANSPVAMIANPGMILGAHTLSKAATGKGLVKGKLGAAIDFGTKATMSAVPGGVAANVAPAALGFVSNQAAAALGVGMRAVNAAKAGQAIAAAAKLAQQRVNLGKAAAAALQAKTTTAAKALPLVKQALATRTVITRNAPALAKQVVQSANIQKAFQNIALKAKSGLADAKLASNVITKSSQALATIQRLEQMNAGGVPGLLITAQGKIVRSPRGKFLQSTAKLAQLGTLYRGRGAPTLRGTFTVAGWESVSGSPAWGGELDPGNSLDGPLFDAVAPTDHVLVDDYAAVAGVLTP